MRYIDYQEKSVRGTFGFPIQLYYVDYTHPQYEMPLLSSAVLALTINGIWAS